MSTPRENLFSSLARSFAPSVFTQWWAKDKDHTQTKYTGASQLPINDRASSSVATIERYAINRTTNKDPANQVNDAHSTVSSSRNLNGKRSLEENVAEDVVIDKVIWSDKPKEIDQPSAKRYRPSMNWTCTYPNTHTDYTLPSSVIDRGSISMHRYTQPEYGEKFPHRPPSAASSTTSSQRSGTANPAIRRRATVNVRAGVGSLSSQTKRILDQLDQMSSPLKDMRKCWVPRIADPVKDVDTFNSTGLSLQARGRLQGPPLSSLASPSRATVLPRIVGISNASKNTRITPYLMSSRNIGSDGGRESSLSQRLAQNEESDRTGGGKIRRMKNLSARGALLDDEEEPLSAPLPSTSTLPGGSGPPAGFLLGDGNLTNRDKDNGAMVTFAFAQPIALDNLAKNLVLPSPITNFSTDKPLIRQIEAPAVVDSTLGKDSRVKWSCPNCFISNESNCDKCVCCSGTRPALSQKCDKTEKATEHKSEQKKESGSKWSCNECFVSNESKVYKCVCCGANREGKTSAPSAAFTPTVFSTASSTFKPAQRTFTPTSNSFTAPATSKWTCESCWVPNDLADISCVCCGASKLSKKTSASSELAKKPNEPNQNTAAPLKDWSCTTCFVSNTGGRSSCVACSSAKPGTTYKPVSFGVSLAKSTTVPVTTCEPCTSSIIASSITSTSSLGVKDSSPTKQTISLTRPSFGIATNDKPGNVPTFGLSAAATATTTSAVFGLTAAASDASKTVSNPPIQFGAPAASDKPVFGLGPVAPAPTLPTFGVKTTSGVTPAANAAPVFAFGASAPTTTVAALPAFGLSCTVSTVSSAVPSTTTSTFAFGMSKPVESTTTATVAPVAPFPTPAPIFAAPNPAALAPVLPFPAPAKPLFANVTGSPKKAEPSSSTALFSFGKRPASVLQTVGENSKPAISATPPFSFVNAPAQAPPPNTTATFAFGAAPATNGPATGFSFGAASNNTNISNGPAGLTNGAVNGDAPFQFKAAASGFATDLFKVASANGPSEAKFSAIDKTQPTIQNQGFNFSSSSSSNGDKGVFQFGNSVSTPNLPSVNSAISFGAPAANPFQVGAAPSSNPFVPTAPPPGRAIMRAKRRGKR